MINGSLKNEHRPDLAEEIHRPPLTVKELRQRLKHIAGLCWGLSIDLNNEIERNAAIIAEFEKLGTENEGLKTQLKEAQDELIKCKDIATQNEFLKLENERLKQAVAMAHAKNRREAIDDHTEQLAWERKTYGNTTVEVTSGYKRRQKGVNKKKLAAEQARAKRKAEFEALPEKERERRLKKRMYQQRYMEKKRAERAQGGNNGSSQN